jgi:hypothetical protein
VSQAFVGLPLDFGENRIKEKKVLNPIKKTLSIFFPKIRNLSRTEDK